MPPASRTRSPPKIPFSPWNPSGKKLLPGPAVANMVAIDKAGTPLAADTLLFHKARPFSGEIPSWQHSIPEMVDGVAAFLVDVRSPNAVEPNRSPPALACDHI